MRCVPGLLPGQTSPQGFSVASAAVWLIWIKVRTPLTSESSTYSSQRRHGTCFCEQAQANRQSVERLNACSPWWGPFCLLCLSLSAQHRALKPARRTKLPVQPPSLSCMAPSSKLQPLHQLRSSRYMRLMVCVDAAVTTIMMQAALRVIAFPVRGRFLLPHLIVRPAAWLCGLSCHNWRHGCVPILRRTFGLPDLSRTSGPARA
jgi:hypothetical protein